MWALGSPVSLLWVFSLLDLAIVAFGQNGQRLFLKPNDTIYTKMDEEVTITCSSFDFPAKNLGQIQNYSIGANASSITECLWTRNVQWEYGNYSEEFHCAVEYLVYFFKERPFTNDNKETESKSYNKSLIFSGSYSIYPSRNKGPTAKYFSNIHI